MVCSRCIYDTRVQGVSFNKEGVCNFCEQVDSLRLQYGTGSDEGVRRFSRIVEEIKRHGRGKEYDCVIGVSGGTDSSYLVHLAVERGLRPLAVHYDNTWNTAIATTNIQRVLCALEVDLYTHVMDNKESDDIFRSFFLAGVAEIEAATDLGFAYVLREASRRFGIGYILEGHSFVEEGVTPLGRNYFDGKYIKSIHRKFGELPMRTYPLMTFSRFLRSILFSRVKIVRPLWYLSYEKKEAQRTLSRLYGWRNYGGHHLENRMSAFYHSVYLPTKFETDMRNHVLSAQVRNGKLRREIALAEYDKPPAIETRIVSLVQKRLRLSDLEYASIMAAPPRDWRDYPNYKKLFETLAPFFKIAANREMVPMSFYLKYCVKETSLK